MYKANQDHLLALVPCTINGRIKESCPLRFFRECAERDREWLVGGMAAVRDTAFRNLLDSDNIFVRSFLWLWNVRFSYLRRRELFNLYHQMVPPFSSTQLVRDHSIGSTFLVCNQDTVFEEGSNKTN